ncbi:hypothetical protein C8Q77DRAFT_1076590 [Trametes polyzona]|nr:hypothetical protein C8Q77DRAFT_1076590 [Trametes polyzona]
MWWQSTLWRPIEASPSLVNWQETAKKSVAQDWQGFDSLRFLIVFGDSFSSVGYSPESPLPSAEEPLGVRFPGETSCERPTEETAEATQQVACDPNWVGHLVREVNSQRAGQTPLRVFDYAIAGDTVARMKLKQVSKEFLPHLGAHPEWAPWLPSDTLFVTWIGINDCTWNLRLKVSSAQATIDDYFGAQEKLYNAGARNFCFIDVPPVHLFPNGPKTPRARTAYEAWNPLLREGARTFSAAHPDATVFLFSSWELFTRIRANPSLVGPTAEGGIADKLFVDGFHLSSAVHAVIAREFLAFLRSQPALGSDFSTT